MGARGSTNNIIHGVYVWTLTPVFSGFCLHIVPIPPLGCVENRTRQSITKPPFVSHFYRHTHMLKINEYIRRARISHHGPVFCYFLDTIPSMLCIKLIAEFLVIAFMLFMQKVTNWPYLDNIAGNTLIAEAFCYAILILQAIAACDAAACRECGLIFSYYVSTTIGCKVVMYFISNAVLANQITIVVAPITFYLIGFCALPEIIATVITLVLVCSRNS
jgi:hypothetical protein